MPGLTALEQIKFDELIKSSLKNYGKIIEEAYQEFLVFGTCKIPELDEHFKEKVECPA